MSKNTHDNRPFSFKQFSLNHHQSTMKVGVDAVLLGIWTDISGVNKALDVGTGAGVISMLLASRGVNSIDAIDIDLMSVNESRQNFENSPFRNQIQVFNQGLGEFEKHHDCHYDLLVSNPPFFIQGLLASTERVSNARHTKTLTHLDLIQSAKKMLTSNGRLSVVLPYSISADFTQQACASGLYLNRKLHIFPRRGLTPNRINMEFTLTKPIQISVEMLNIREENGSYTQQFLQLTNDYYLE